MAEYYRSIYTGKQIDDGIGRIISGELDELADKTGADVLRAKAEADRAKKEADNAKAYAQKAAQSEQKASESASGAQEAMDAAEAEKQAAQAAKAGAEQAKSSASFHASAAADSALLSQSWAEGGTGVRAEEDTDNAEYWANRAQAYAEQTNNPAVVQGVYNYILQDRNTGARYALLVEGGVLKLLGVSEGLDAASLVLIDTVSGLSYELVVETGVVKLLEVQ